MCASLLNSRRMKDHPLWKPELLVPGCVGSWVFPLSQLSLCTEDAEAVGLTGNWSPPWASSPAWTSNPASSQPPLPFLYIKPNQWQGFLSQRCSCSFSSNYFFLLINVKLKFNLITCTGELLDPNEGWAWKYLSVLSLGASPEGDVFQGWKKSIKRKGVGGSQPLPTARRQPSEKRNELSELKGSARGRPAAPCL